MKVIIRIGLTFCNIIGIVGFLISLYMSVFYISIRDFSLVYSLTGVIASIGLLIGTYTIWIKMKQESFSWKTFLVFIIIDSFTSMQ